MRTRRNPEIIAGRVTSTGLVSAGRDFSVINVSTGIYTVTLPTDFHLLSAAVTLATGLGAGVTANVAAYTNNTFQVAVATSAGAGSAQAFAFTAVGEV